MNRFSILGIPVLYLVILMATLQLYTVKTKIKLTIGLSFHFKSTIANPPKSYKENKNKAESNQGEFNYFWATVIFEN